MSAREQLIRAYAFSTLKPSSGGDFDLGARGTHKPIGRKSRGKFTDPMHCSESKRKAINSSSIVMNALIAGKIISAAEGERPYQGAYSRIYYSEAPMRRDKAVLGSYLTHRVMEDKNLTEGIIGASQAILYFSKASKYIELSDNPSVSFLQNVIDRIDQRVLKAVGLCVKELDTP